MPPLEPGVLDLDEVVIESRDASAADRCEHPESVLFDLVINAPSQDPRPS